MTFRANLMIQTVHTGPIKKMCSVTAVFSGTLWVTQSKWD